MLEHCYSDSLFFLKNSAWILICIPSLEQKQLIPPGEPSILGEKNVLVLTRSSSDGQLVYLGAINVFNDVRYKELEKITFASWHVTLLFEGGGGDIELSK